MHCAAVFSVSQYWLVSYSHSSAFLDALNDAIHVFRMPLFFMIAGFFACMLLNRYTVQRFISQRAKRILIPLLSAFLIFNTFQSVLLYWYEAPGDASNQSLSGMSFGLFHLWFLVNLMIYCALLAVLMILARKGSFGLRKEGLKEKGLTQKSLQETFERAAFIVVLALFPFAYIGILVLGKLGLPIYDMLPIVGMLHTLVYYGCFFVFGALCYAQKHWVAQIEKHVFAWAVLCALSTALLLNMPSFEGIVYTTVLEYLKSFHALVSSLLVWALFSRLANGKRAWLSDLSQASYTIYLSHHALIVLIVIMLNIWEVSLPVWLLFPAMVAVVYVLTLSLHKYVIKRSAWLALLFNGK